MSLMTSEECTPVTMTGQVFSPVTNIEFMSMTALPAWYPDPEESKPAPVPLLLLQAFVNTLDHDTGVDLLADGQSAARWFSSAGLLARSAPVSVVDLELAREVRDGLRRLLELPGGEQPPAQALEPLRRLVEAHPPRVVVGDDGAIEVTSGGGDDTGDALCELLLIARAAQQDGTWTRLRVCANPECGWVFYDRSRNQQGQWCDMAVCGNRLKNRRLRSRRATASRAPAQGHSS